MWQKKLLRSIGNKLPSQHIMEIVCVVYAFACTALLDATLFAVPKTEKPLLSLRLFSPAGIRPARLCSTVQPSPFPARKNFVFSGCGRSPYKKIGHLPFESKLSSALTDLFARLSAYPKFLILNSFSASRF